MNQVVTAGPVIVRKSRARRSIGRAAVAAAVALSTALPPMAFAQTAPTTNATAATTRPAGGLAGVPRGVTTSPQGLMVNFQDVPVDTVLNELSAAAGFIVIKEVKPEGKVTLQSRQPLSNEDAINALNTVLLTTGRGYVAIQQDRILKIVDKDSAKRRNIPVRTGNDPAQVANTDELITQVIPIRYADATLLKTDLAPLIDSETPFTSNASTNVLIITDTSANVRRLVTIVKSLDTSVADAVDVKVFPLKFASATSAATLINQVFANMNAARTQGSPDQGGGQQGGGGGGPGGGGFGGFGNFGRGGNNRGNNNNNSRGSGNQRLVTAAADERTNSVVVSGQADTLTIVANVIKELDANPAAEETMFVYRLRNAQALSVESTLNALFTGQPPTNRTQQNNADILRQNRSSGTLGNTGGRQASSNARTTNRQTSSTGGAGGFFGGGAFFGGNAGRFSNNARNAASALAGEVTLIADTDSNSLLIRTSPTNYEQVKAILDEIDRPVAQVLIKVLIAEVTHTNEFDAGVQFSALNLRNGTDNGQQGGTSFNIPVTGANATGLVVQILETNFTAAIRALEQAGRLEVLSRPYILASDNQLASITVGSEVPFVDSSRITEAGQTINTVDYRDVGILLDVIPHINPDGLVILDVAPEISTLLDSTVPISDGVTAPIISKRSAQSRVSVRSGSTIVIGGLMQDQLTETISKVPLLGDIPGLGELFKRRQRRKDKTELLIFLTPHVAAQPADLETMSVDEQKGMRLVPNAVGPGVFQEHLEGLERGNVRGPVGSTTQPSIDDPTTKPAPAQIYDDARNREGRPLNFRRSPGRRGGGDGGGFNGGDGGGGFNGGDGGYNNGGFNGGDGGGFNGGGGFNDGGGDGFGQSMMPDNNQ